MVSVPCYKYDIELWDYFHGCYGSLLLAFMANRQRGVSCVRNVQDICTVVWSCVYILIEPTPGRHCRDLQQWDVCLLLGLLLHFLTRVRFSAKPQKSLLGESPT